MMTVEESKRIAGTIIKQLGGNQFITMTGAKNFTCDGPTAIFKIGRNASRANYVKITLNSMDLYDIEFVRANVKGLTVMDEYSNIYNDQLRGLFERVTGLRTSLTEVYA